jgi:hypothetical protein
MASKGSSTGTGLAVTAAGVEQLNVGQHRRADEVRARSVGAN